MLEFPARVPKAADAQFAEAELVVTVASAVSVYLSGIKRGPCAPGSLRWRLDIGRIHELQQRCGSRGGIAGCKAFINMIIDLSIVGFDIDDKALAIEAATPRVAAVE